MTPTAKIAAIRQRAENAKEIGAVSVAWSQDIPFLLQQIDARESALRALAAEVRDRIEYMQRDTDWYRAQELEYWKRKLERLLESEQ